ncbi:MAG: tetratricopeptide repeat protein [Candidatus Omnitrophica bacterium]|nr:tetratricopeptide repeat protein [Candidatus Omnitrophota bacterium]
MDNDDQKSGAGFVAVSYSNERLLYSEEILEDAKRAYHALKGVGVKMNALIDLQVICVAGGKVDDFLAICMEALKDERMSQARPDILYRMGSACQEVGRDEEALEHYLASAEFDTGVNEVRYMRLAKAAFCYLLKAEPLKARELCKSAIVIDPEHWVAWKNLAMALEALDEPGEAANCYARAIKLSNANIIPIIHIRELVKKRSERIRNLAGIRDELMEKHGVMV